MTRKRPDPPPPEAFHYLVGALVGLRPGQGNVVGSLRQCDGCGSLSAELVKGTSTHPLRARCRPCGRHVTWLPAPAIAALVAAGLLPSPR